jgi:hypothetical protein
VDQGAEAAVRLVQAARGRPSAGAGLGEARRARLRAADAQAAGLLAGGGRGWGGGEGEEESQSAHGGGRWWRRHRAVRLDFGAREAMGRGCGRVGAGSAARRLGVPLPSANSSVLRAAHNGKGHGMDVTQNLTQHTCH